MSFHSNLHMIIGSQQMLSRYNMVVARDIHEEKNIESQAGEKPPKDKIQKPSIFLNMVRREFSDKLACRPKM